MRSGADLNGVVSFHGLLGAPGNTAGNTMTAKALVLHGWKDPMATPDQVMDFTREMDELGADWQLHAYGNALHAFTNPQANDPGHGLLYDPLAEHRSCDSMLLFLNEIFA